MAYSIMVTALNAMPALCFTPNKMCVVEKQVECVRTRSSGWRWWGWGLLEQQRVVHMDGLAPWSLMENCPASQCFQHKWPHSSSPLTPLHHNHSKPVAVEEQAFFFLWMWRCRRGAYKMTCLVFFVSLFLKMLFSLWRSVMMCRVTQWQYAKKGFSDCMPTGWHNGATNLLI